MLLQTYDPFPVWQVDCIWRHSAVRTCIVVRSADKMMNYAENISAINTTFCYGIRADNVCYFVWLFSNWEARHFLFDHLLKYSLR